MWYHFLTNDIPAAIFHLLFPFPDHPLLIFYFIFFIFYFFTPRGAPYGQAL